MPDPHFLAHPVTSVSRRTTLRLGASSLAAGLANRGLHAAKAQAAPATFVLVPGQWTGAFVWDMVVPLLRDAGHAVYAVTCTGLGDRVHLDSPAIDLDTHITDVVNTIEYADLHDVILVGHDSAGMVITGVAETIPERLAQVVYLDASLPRDGQNFYEATFTSKEARKNAIAADIAGGVEAGMPGFRPVLPSVMVELVGAITDPVRADRFVAMLAPHPELTNLQQITLGNAAAAALPRTFILCTADKDLEADPQTDANVLTVERVRSDPQWRIIELDEGHMVALNAPQATAEALLSLL